MACNYEGIASIFGQGKHESWMGRVYGYYTWQIRY